MKHEETKLACLALNFRIFHFSFFIFHSALILLLAAQISFAEVSKNAGDDLSLNGEWETGIERNYTNRTPVPGLAQNPGEMSPGTLWYRRTVQLPEGNWTTAALRLKGARFAPAVYVNGEKISEHEPAPDLDQRQHLRIAHLPQRHPGLRHYGRSRGPGARRRHVLRRGRHHGGYHGAVLEDHPGRRHRGERDRGGAGYVR